MKKTIKRYATAGCKCRTCLKAEAENAMKPIPIVVPDGCGLVIHQHETPGVVVIDFAPTDNGVIARRDDNCIDIHVRGGPPPKNGFTQYYAFSANLTISGVPCEIVGARRDRVDGKDVVKLQIRRS